MKFEIKLINPKFCNKDDDEFEENACPYLVYEDSYCGRFHKHLKWLDNNKEQPFYRLKECKKEHGE